MARTWGVVVVVEAGAAGCVHFMVLINVTRMESYWKGTSDFHV